MFTERQNYNFACLITKQLAKNYDICLSIHKLGCVYINLKNLVGEKRAYLSAIV